MSKLKTKSYELRDVAIVQAPISFMNHRAEVNPKVSIAGREVYPIFVAPMSCVTDQNNYRVWIDSGLTPVIPRSVMKSEFNESGLSFEERMKLAEETFVSVSLNEAKFYLPGYLKEYSGSGKLYICIDIAHGTLSDLYELCRRLKFVVAPGKIEIMTGNVANPKAYSLYADSGVDWMRVSIGSGSRCITSASVAVHYGMATLLDQINEERKAYAHSHNGCAPTKIIADGGIGWFDDIQKSLALGADAVMAGKIFAECEEAAGEIYYSETPLVESKYSSKGCSHRYRDYYGMSTKRAQKITGGSGTKTSEGISRPVEVKYPVAEWVDNMQSYLRSCMTYTNSRTIQELRENAQLVILGGSGDTAYRK